VDAAQDVLDVHLVAGAVVVLHFQDLGVLEEWNMQPL
jgi:hypothetical protein